MTNFSPSSGSLGLLVKGSAGTSAHVGGSPFELRAGPFAARELEVVSFTGAEAANSPYAYDIVFDSAIPAVALRAAVYGFPACLSMGTATREPRVVQGIVIGFGEVGATGIARQTDVRRYAMRLAPRLWLLRHNRSYRVFQDMTAIDVACAVLRAADITPTLRLERGDYPPLPFLYQRGETDLEFFDRVLAVAGVTYYFEHASGWLDSLIPGGSQAVSLADGLLGSAVEGVASAVGAATKLVLCDLARRTTPLAPSPVLATAGVAAGTVLRALGGPVAAAAASGVEAATGASGAIPYDADGGAVTASERIFSFCATSEVRPKEVTIDAWDPAESRGVQARARSSPLTVDASGGLSASLDAQGGVSVAGGLAGGVGLAAAGLAGALSAYLDADALGLATTSLAVTEYQRDASLLAASDPFAARALSQLRSDRVTARGESDCRRLAPGYRFVLTRHPIAPVNTEYVVTKVQSSGYAPSHLPAERLHLFRTTFECVPSSVDLRPPKPHARAPLAPEYATVVGPTYGDVHCDSLGRIFVRLHWAPATETFSETADGVCRVQWLERFAGNGYGTVTLPRVGSEVLLHFLQEEGNPPIAIGQLYSRQDVPPFVFPREASKLGIRSRTLPSGGGHSEISIDDRPGGKVYVRAQEDHETDVLANRRVHVRGNETTQVDGSAVHTVQGAHRVEVGASATLAVAGSQTSTVGENLASTVTGNAIATFGGAVQASIDRTLSVYSTDGVALDAGAGFTVVAAELRTTVARDEIRVIGGHQRTHVGTDAGTQAGAGSDTSVAGPYSLSASGPIVLQSPTGITLRCGASEISLTPQTIALLAQVVQGAATKQLELAGPGPSITLTSAVDVMAKSVTLQSSGAQLALSDAAALTGSAVKLGSGSGDAPALASPAFGAPRVLSLCVLDSAGKALANATYQLAIAGKTSRGTTDSAGSLQSPIDPTATSGRLTVWTGDFPEGPRIVYDLDLGQLGDGHTLKGAQQRLVNLGYHRGAITGRMDLATRDALLVFQAQHGVPVTGLLDEPTIAALATRHP